MNPNILKIDEETKSEDIFHEEAELLALESRFCSYGDTVHYAAVPKIFERCSGSFLYDAEDTPYLDLQMWYSTANLGYANPRVSDAVKRQMDKLPQLASQYLHREKIELAAHIGRSIEERFGLKGRVHFNVGGAQAVEDALKIVRRNTGRQRMLAFEGGYHGRTLGASSITSSYRYREPFGEFPERAHFEPYPYCFRCPYDKKRESCELYCAQQFERKFKHEFSGFWNPKTGHSEFGAFFIEPVQGTGGYIIPPAGYLQRIAKACQDHGILVVADEVQMGLYRTGKLWSIEHSGVKPDIIIFGKSLTNGLNPLSGIWAREELISPEKFGPGSTHSTYSSNTIGTAAGLEVMKIFSEKDYGKMVTEKGAYFLGLLKDLQKVHPEIGNVDGLGLALRMEICEADGVTPNRLMLDRMFQTGLKGDLNSHGRKLGLVLNVGGYYKNVVNLAPSLEISYEEMDLAHDLLDQIIKKTKRTI